MVVKKRSTPKRPAAPRTPAPGHQLLVIEVIAPDQYLAVDKGIHDHGAPVVELETRRRHAAAEG